MTVLAPFVLFWCLNKHTVFHNPFLVLCCHGLRRRFTPLVAALLRPVDGRCCQPCLMWYGSLCGFSCSVPLQRLHCMAQHMFMLCREGLFMLLYDGKYIVCAHNKACCIAMLVALPVNVCFFVDLCCLVDPSPSGLSWWLRCLLVA